MQRRWTVTIFALIALKVAFADARPSGAVTVTPVVKGADVMLELRNNTKIVATLRSLTMRVEGCTLRLETPVVLGPVSMGARKLTTTSEVLRCINKKRSKSRQLGRVDIATKRPQPGALGVTRVGHIDYVFQLGKQKRSITVASNDTVSVLGSGDMP